MEIKLCECGCGFLAPISTHTINKLGRIKGQPVRFITGHNGCLRKRSTHCPKGHELSGDNVLTSIPKISLHTGKPYRERIECRICVLQRMKHRRSTPEGKTERVLGGLKVQGVSAEELLRAKPIVLEFFSRSKDRQQCPICEDNCSGRKQFAADHNHKTNRFRAMICAKCNHTLGLAREREDLLGNGKLGQYLKKHAGEKEELKCH